MAHIKRNTNFPLSNSLHTTNNCILSTNGDFSIESYILNLPSARTIYLYFSADLPRCTMYFQRMIPTPIAPPLQYLLAAFAIGGGML